MTTPDMPLKATRFDVDGPVATVWLHRPHRHNAWTGRMHAEYRSIMATLEADRAVRAVVVTGTPPAFCVGGAVRTTPGSPLIGPIPGTACSPSSTTTSRGTTATACPSSPP
jgi:enoyl-CoA hydratase/carnithine racemase